MKTRLPLVAVVVLLLLSGCAGGKSITVQEAFPSQGQWLYDEYDGDKPFTYAVERNPSLGGFTDNETTTKDQRPFRQGYRVFKMRNDGLVRVDTNSPYDTSRDTELWFPAHLSPGTTFQEGKVKWAAEAWAEVEVPAGKFQCLMVVHTLSELIVYRECYAPGVGLVQLSWGNSFRWLLRSYKIKGH